MHENKNMSTQFAVLSLSAIARVVFHNNVSAASRLRAKCELAVRHLRVERDSVCLADPASFDAELACYKSRVLSDEKSALVQLVTWTPCENHKKEFVP